MGLFCFWDGAMRVVTLVLLLLLATRTATAGGPSGFACGKGKPKPDRSGCDCPGGHADRRDAENNAICVAVGPNHHQLFLKAIADNDLVKAAELAVKIDGSSDAGATAALAKSFDSWLTSATTEMTRLEREGRCHSMSVTTRRGEDYERVWVGLMQQIDKRNPSMNAGQNARTRHLSAMSTLESIRRACFSGANRPERDALANDTFAKTRASYDRCAARYKGPPTTIQLGLVVDVDGNAISHSVGEINPKPANREADELRTCVIAWTRATRFTREGAGYRARLSLPAGAAPVEVKGGTEGTLAIKFMCDPGTPNKPVGCTCPATHESVIDDELEAAICQLRKGKPSKKKPPKPAEPDGPKISGYQCAPGTPLEGVGCKCPAPYEALVERDLAICRQNPSPKPTASQYTALVSQANDHADAYNCLKAEESYQKALAIKPDGVEALVGSGNCLARQSKWTNAHVRFDKALAIDPKYEPALWGRAEAYRLAYRKDDAIAAYKQYLVYFPNAEKAKQALDKVQGSTTNRPAPPSSYRCAPGTPVKGVGCRCPAGYDAKREADGSATCRAIGP